MMNKWLKKAILFLSLSILIEVLFFNFQSIISKSYKTYDGNLSVYYGSEFKEQDGQYILDESETTSTIEIYDIEDKINNVYVDFEINGDSQTVKTEYYLSDEGNKDLYLINNNDIIWNNNVLASKYTRIHSYGDVHTILIKINKSEGETLKINSISLNTQRPFFISKVRIIVLFIIMMVISLYLGKDNLLGIRLSNIDNNKKKVLIIGLILIQIIIGLSVGIINKELVDNKYNEQYQLLTDALLKGQVNIDVNVDKKLTELDNPYDVSERLASGTSYEFDTAFYNNKYYVYFGVAPVIMYYLPFKLITNTYLCDYVVNIINFIIFSISFILLAYKVTKKYFKDTPVLIFILLNIVIINSCGALYLLSEPRIYTITILMGLAYSILGLTLWVYSKKKNKLNNLLVILGSLSIGIAIASRPQFGLFAFFAFVIFADEIKDIKNNALSLVLSIIPFIIVGGLLMYYNYIRFGSVFDFGANYNLTFNDMTKRGFEIDRILGGLYYYLAQPLSLSATFPYLNGTTFSSNYVGLIIQEHSFGGLLFICPLTLASLFIFKARKWFDDNKLYIFSIICIIFGLIVIIVDTNMAGLVERYFGDFSIYFLMASSLIILSYINKSEISVNKLYKLLSVVCMCCLVYCFFRLFANTYQALELCNPKIYYKVLSYFLI